MGNKDGLGAAFLNSDLVRKGKLIPAWNASKYNLIASDGSG